MFFIAILLIVILCALVYIAEIPVSDYIKKIETFFLSLGPKDPKEPPKVVPKKGKFVSKGEQMCKDTLEKIYGVPFPNVRPPFLINPKTGRRLELDCYWEEGKLAVEYNGEQHYKWPNFTNQTREKFEGQQYRDKIKIELCKKHGIHLIVVPYTVKHNEIPKYIVERIPEVVSGKVLAYSVLRKL